MDLSDVSTQPNAIFVSFIKGYILKILKISVLLFLILQYVSCSYDIRIEADRRIQVVGEINSTLDNISVYSIAGNQAGSYSQEEGHLLGRGMSKNGSFDFVSLKPENAGISILINPPGFDNYTNTISTTFINVQPQNRLRIINIPEISLPELASVQVNFINISGAAAIAYQIAFLPPVNEYAYTNTGELEVSGDFFNRVNLRSNSLENSDSYIEDRIKSLVGTKVEIIYSVDEGEELTESFIIEDQNVLYEIEY
ncbi:hypothetical protein [Gramella sp. AN32]|uniref:Uncharacterized protein n=1 Tax=Christiangramia antarctica TaxID=2058158 RepID=A0ABW5X0Y4_9FLAO|nr:hypothetical protein [Gramella sp. AN32]MCM4155048.1 hypothetical protein [Gramella sp. AN32]